MSYLAKERFVKTKKKSTKLELNFRISLMMDVIHEYWLESSFQNFTNSWLSIFKIQGKSCFQSSIPRWFGGEETTNMRCALSVEEFFSQPASFFFFKQMQSTSVAVPRHEHEAFFRVPTPFCLPCPGSQLLYSTAPPHWRVGLDPRISDSTRLQSPIPPAAWCRGCQTIWAWSCFNLCYARNYINCDC